MDGSSPLIENLRQLFSECDTDQNGSLGMDEFGDLCNKIGLNMDVAAETFERLDIDKNGKITFDEFAAGFIQTCKQQPPRPAAPRQPGAAGSSPAWNQGQQQASASLSSANGRLATPSPVASRARKSASPLGIMSLGSTGSSSSCSNLASTSSSSNTAMSSLRSTASHNQMFASSSGSVGGDISGPSSGLGVAGGAGLESHHLGSGGANGNGVVVYSSDMIESSACDYDQASGSGQFGSLLSNGSSNYNQVKTMQDLLDCVQKLQNENQILSQIFFKDKREREEYISQLGEEFDQQLREVEERANRRAREELENEKKRLREMMQAERETLQHHYQTLEKVSKLVKSPSGGAKLEGGETFDKVRSKLEDTFMENRQLKKSLLDTKTDVALIWKEMEKLKKQYEDKLSSAYEKHNETKNECDHIKQQLSLMKDSNRRLQDASDVITNYITDKVEPVIKVASNLGGDDADAGSLFLSPNNGFGGPGGSPANSRRGSILSEYLNDNNNRTNSTDDNGASSMSGDLESQANRCRENGARPPGVKQTDGAKAQTNKRPDSNKSMSSLADELKRSELGESLINDQVGKDLRINSESILSLVSNSSDGAGSHAAPVNGGKINEISNSKQETQPTAPSNLKTSASAGLRNIGRHFLLGSRNSSSSLSSSDAKTKDPINETSTNHITKNSTSERKLSSNTIDRVDELIIEQADGPSKATFNIILVGDSFVGKSSFAARFMEGSFVQGLISNCSIDFKTKAYKVDGVNYTINLWDTAGQERFRSITASYFRKADGIILMYDVTDKRSYLNVRNWMSTISDTAAENVAVLLVGNKIDLRQKDNKHKCVPTEEGSRLAREYDIVFLETSVKTGTNLLPSMGQLIRLIAKNNIEEEEEDKDRIRLNDKNRAFNCMPKNC